MSMSAKPFNLFEPTHSQIFSLPLKGVNDIKKALLIIAIFQSKERDLCGAGCAVLSLVKNIFHFGAYYHVESYWSLRTSDFSRVVLRRQLREVVGVRLNGKQKKRASS